MSLIVQKFGGTSVATVEKILAAARKAIRAHHEGHDVIMVVSAMGKNTDMLVGLANEISDRPPAREMDMLLSTGEQVSVALMAMAIHSLGHEAISLTGAQIGIVTDSSHTRARIRSISTDRMQKLLKENKIIIAAGFQGVDDDGNITTLGRGGSDTTAVALAAVMNADACEIYTDVDGVYTTDPRVVPEARRLERISYDEMLELASVGAGVMHNRSIEFAKKFSVPICVRSSSGDGPGTMIVEQCESLERPVSGCAISKNEARITIRGVPDRPGAALTIFSHIADKKIPIDMIVQNVAEGGTANISFTVTEDDLLQTIDLVEEAIGLVGAKSYSCDKNVAKVSIVGLGMAHQSGVAKRMFRALADKEINIFMITTSEIKVSVLVDRDNAIEALRTLHRIYELDVVPSVIEPIPSPADHKKELGVVSAEDKVDIVARLEGMEDLMIEDVVLDITQARITLNNVPDQPGLAATVFEEIANKSVVVDMIVQSVGEEGVATISFTVPRHDVEAVLMVSRELAEQYGCEEPEACPEVAKLSVLGTGMKSHTDVATRTFQSLAQSGINVSIISTSEARVNIVVEDKSGEESLEVLSSEFDDVMM